MEIVLDAAQASQKAENWPAEADVLILDWDGQKVENLATYHWPLEYAK